MSHDCVMENVFGSSQRDIADRLLPLIDWTEFYSLYGELSSAMSLDSPRSQQLRHRAIADAMSHALENPEAALKRARMRALGRATNRSRSSLAQEAVDRYLADMEREQRGARVRALAAEVFGGQEKAERWLQRNNRLLGDAPVHLLGTEAGTEMVETVLHRIEHGIFS
jgi:putative toxin-antitoxin system antitoxin component (TIGR02293 family)